MGVADACEVRLTKYPTFVRKSCFYIDNIVANCKPMHRQDSTADFHLYIKVPDLNQYATETLTTVSFPNVYILK